MAYERRYDWRKITGTVDRALMDRIEGVIGHVLLQDSEIPRKYKELILMCCAATLRYGSSVRSHGTAAISQGATDKEVIEALSLASMTGGFTVLIEAIEALGDKLAASGSSGAEPASRNA